MSQKISVERLGKRYTIAARNNLRHPSLVLAAASRLSSLLRIPRHATGLGDARDFWALDDISFQVGEGEIVGIIGKNGSGKSTLLKILSRITPPTTGLARIEGRLSSLLEVGTGFHPELTGRENVFLNGSLLGMGRAEIQGKFDEIIEFAQISKFIDMPVKHYSSGMYVRLAFAVAAHLDPDILVVDEVLSVGDGGFQRKCIGKMEQVAAANRTILFVSHNLLAVRALCKRVIVLDGGKLVSDGSTEAGITTYSRLIADTTDLQHRNAADRKARASGAVRFVDAKITDSSRNERSSFVMGETIFLNLKYRCMEKVPSLGIKITIGSALSGESLTTIKHILSPTPVTPANSSASISIEIPDIMLRPGDYTLYIWLGNKELDSPWDILDDNVNLPWLTIKSEQNDEDDLRGYFYIPAKISVSSP